MQQFLIERAEISNTDVTEKSIDSFLRARCRPSQILSEKPQDVRVYVQKKPGAFQSAYCVCFAGDVVFHPSEYGECFVTSLRKYLRRYLTLSALTVKTQITGGSTKVFMFNIGCLLVVNIVQI